MEQNKTSSRLFTTNAIEKREELDEKFDKGYAVVQGLVSGLSEKEAHDALNNAICKGPQNYEDVCLGLVATILTEPQCANKAYRDLTFLSRDGMQLVTQNIGHIILEKYSRLLDLVRQQLLWLLREFIRNSVTHTESLCLNLLRQVAGGDLNNKNIWLADSLLGLFEDNRTWLDKYGILIAVIVYTYLRLIEDHYGPSVAQLRQREVTFVVQLLRDRFTECMRIGRDLVRLLQNVARIPEFDKFWRDMLLNPTSLSPHFKGIPELLQTRTSRRFLQCRLSPDMERKILFITSQVKFGMQKRYQDWFQRQYLSTQESQSLRCDLIRFIVGVIHPTNELLCSDIIPRWAVIGWLLTTCTSNIAASNAKLALFYDWLFFEPENDNIMNIEPAILVMHHSMRTYPAITATLLDFLCRIIPNFYAPMTERIQTGVHTSLRQILEKRVLPSLCPLFDNPRLDRELRIMVKERFPEFCTPESVKDGNSLDRKDEYGMKNNNLSDTDPTFSDDEDEPKFMPLNNQAHHLKGKKDDTKDVITINDDFPELKDIKFQPTKIETSPPPMEVEQLELLEAELQVLVRQLWQERESEERQCEVMQTLVRFVVSDRTSRESCAHLAACVLKLLQHSFSSSLLPEDRNDESIEDSLGKPLFVAFRELSQFSDGDKNRDPLLLFLVELAAQQSHIGYYLLYFLRASRRGEVSMKMYKDFCEERNEEDFGSNLANDLELCQDVEGELFLWLFPQVYSVFPEGALGNTRLLHLLVSFIDASQLHTILCRIFTGSLVMFKRDSFLDVLKVSLEWETWEQVCVWQLVTAHSIPVDYILPLLPKLQHPQHAEALSAVLLLLRQERPTADLVRQLLSRDNKLKDILVPACLNHWAQEHEDTLADLVSSSLKHHSGASAQGKRKRGQSGKPTPQLEISLAHLNRFRMTCRQTSFLNMDRMLSALQTVHNACTEAQKKRYSDLFALIDEAEVKSPTKTGNRNKKGTNSNAKKLPRPGSSDSSTEEEEIVKPKPFSKKRKKPNPVNSDSD